MNRSIPGNSMRVVYPRRSGQMDNTHEFVEKLHDTQEKAARNKKHQGKGAPSQKLATKQHGTQK